MKELNVGIIGLGAVGERLLKQFLAHPKTNVQAISDVDEERMEEWKRTLTDVCAYVDYRDLLADESVDVVHVAVPPKLHHSIVIDVLQAGKHVLCEKPLANSLEEAKDMYEKAEASGVIHAIHFPLPYSKPVHILSEKVKNGEIGMLQRIELTMQFPVWPRAWQQNPWIASREQGGFVREITPHYIQLIQQMFGSIQNVQTFIKYPENKEDCETDIIARAELDDGTHILINGISGIGKKEEIAFHVYGDEGVLSLINWGKLISSSLGEEPMVVERENSHLTLIDEFVKAWNGDHANLVTFKEGYNVQKVLEKLLDK